MGFLMMKCPKCGGATKVLKKERAGYNTIARIRKCKRCDFVFRTTEAPSRRDESLIAYLNRVANEVQGDDEQ